MGIKINSRLFGVLAVAISAAFTIRLHAQVNVTTYHNDNSRSGENARETVLTPANVNSEQFGKLFTAALDGNVYAQPLYLAGVSIGGGRHNVLYVATEHDSLYAIDADSGAVYWHISLIPAGGSTVNSLRDLGCADLVPEIGITGTPVIDTNTGTIYLVAKSKVGGVLQQSLHAIDVSLATEKFGGPVNIQASVRANSGKSVSFSPTQEHQRAALLLSNGHVVIGWGSHCDIAPWHGWVMSYAAGTLAQEAVFNSTPNGNFGGVWMSGSGIAADASGSLYFSTGNGTWDGATDYGDSVVKLGPPSGGSFPVLDYFTPYNQAYLEDNDLDVSSGGLVLLPTLPSGQQLLAQMSKTGELYMVDRNSMGKYCGDQIPACTKTDPQIPQDIANATVGIWGSPAYWNGTLYWGGGNDNTGQSGKISAFGFNTGSGVVTKTPTSQSAHAFGFSAPVPSISANGTTDGILWGLDDSAWDSTCSGATHCQVLYAYDATNLANLLYTSDQAAKARDVPGGAIKFATPIISNGKVYVGSHDAVSAFGLLGGSTTTTTTGGGSASSGGASSSTSVSLAAAANIEAIGNTGTPINARGGIDGSGDAYSSSLLGKTVTWSGATFTLGTADALDAADATTLSLPSGSYSTLYLLATGVNGSQPNQTFTVTYTDGTTTTIKQSLSDWYTPEHYAGESEALTETYRLIDTGAVDDRTFYVYGYAFAINSAKTVKSLKLPSNANVVVLAVSLGAGAATAVTPAPAAATGSTPVSFAATANIRAIAKNGATVLYGGVDGAGDAYSSALLGTTAAWSGVAFTLGAPGVDDAVSGATIGLPAGNFATLYVLATAVNHEQSNQTFTVTYTDGTSTTVTQSLSSWLAPQNFTGESQALTGAYWLNANGVIENKPCYLYGYALAINAAKTVASVTPPNNRDVVVLALTLKP